MDPVRAKVKRRVFRFLEERAGETFGIAGLYNTYTCTGASLETLRSVLKELVGSDAVRVCRDDATGEERYSLPRLRATTHAVS